MFWAGGVPPAGTICWVIGTIENMTGIIFEMLNRFQKTMQNYLNVCQ